MKMRIMILRDCRNLYEHNFVMDTHILFRDIYSCLNRIFRSSVALTFTINLSNYTNFEQSSFANKKNIYGLRGNKNWPDNKLQCKSTSMQTNSVFWSKCYTISHPLMINKTLPYIFACEKVNQNKYFLVHNKNILI